MKLNHRIIVSLLVSTLFFSASSFSPNRSTSLLEDVLSQTNQFRRSKGMPALVMNQDLNAIAEKHSMNMAKGRVAFGHGGFAKRNKEAQKMLTSIHSFAENVAYGPTTGKAVVDGWKNSTGHRKNLLGRFKYIGIGTAKDRKGRIYYTQVFAG